HQTPWWFSVSLAWAEARGQWSVMVPEGGMGAVAQALARNLQIRLNTTVHRAAFEPGGHVRLRTERPAGWEPGDAARRVLATPAPVTLALLQNPDEALGFEEATLLRSTRYTSNLTTAVAYDGPPEERAYGVSVPLASGSPLAAIGWEHLKDPRRV